jgi:hypothetical protein
VAGVSRRNTIGGESFTGVPSGDLYRLPYADGTRVKVFDDFQSHRPQGWLDLFAISGERLYAIVAAAAGRIVAIRDNFSERQSGRAPPIAVIISPGSLTRTANGPGTHTWRSTRSPERRNCTSAIQSKRATIERLPIDLCAESVAHCRRSLQALRMPPFEHGLARGTAYR